LPGERAVSALGDKPNVGRHRVQRKPSAAVDDHRHFRSEPGSQPGLVDARPDRPRQRARIGGLVPIEASERPGLHRHAGANGDPQRIDLSGRPWQLTTTTMYGALRMQPGKVVSILCSDTSGADITP